MRQKRGEGVGNKLKAKGLKLVVDARDLSLGLPLELKLHEQSFKLSSDPQFLHFNIKNIDNSAHKCLQEFLYLQSCVVTPLVDQFQESLPRFFAQTSE